MPFDQKVQIGIDPDPSLNNSFLKFHPQNSAPEEVLTITWRKAENPITRPNEKMSKKNPTLILEPTLSAVSTLFQKSQTPNIIVRPSSVRAMALSALNRSTVASTLLCSSSLVVSSRPVNSHQHSPFSFFEFTKLQTQKRKAFTH